MQEQDETNFRSALLPDVLPNDLPWIKVSKADKMILKNKAAWEVDFLAIECENQDIFNGSLEIPSFVESSKCVMYSKASWQSVEPSLLHTWLHLLNQATTELEY